MEFVPTDSGDKQVIGLHCIDKETDSEMPCHSPKVTQEGQDDFP